MDPLVILILALTAWLIISRWWVMTWESMRHATWYRRFDAATRIAYVGLLVWFVVRQMG